MAKAKKAKQCSFTLQNRAGLLSEVTTALARAKVNINAICAYEWEEKAVFMLSTDSPAKTKRVLAPLGIEIKEEDVVAVEMSNKVGELQKVAKRVGDAGMNINYIFGTTSAGKSSICILKTEDDKRAIGLINKK
ncbi:MAG: ACT domain-containing protein [Nitrospirota bacterium]|jgi:hypothetical protein